MGNIVEELYRLLAFTVRIYTIILFIRVIISWIPHNPRHPAAQMLYRVTEPLLAPVRRMVARRIGNYGIDFSPFIVMISLQIFMRILYEVLASLGVFDAAITQIGG